MIVDPLALHVCFSSALVKTAAVTRSFPRGVECLDARYPIARTNKCWSRCGSFRLAMSSIASTSCSALAWSQVMTLRMAMVPC